MLRSVRRISLYSSIFYALRSKVHVNPFILSSPCPAEMQYICYSRHALFPTSLYYHPRPILSLSWKCEENLSRYVTCQRNQGSKTVGQKQEKSSKSNQLLWIKIDCMQKQYPFTIFI